MNRRPSARRLLLAAFLLLAAGPLIPSLLAAGNPGRIYTAPDPASPGGIEGRSPVPVTHALAVDRDRIHVYRGKLSDGGRKFSFEHLPVGKYDIVLVDEAKAIYEGVSLGGPTPALPANSMENLRKRVAAADAFFNRHQAHRIGFEGDHCYAFVERLRDRDTMTQGGAAMGNVTRLEIIDFQQAQDDWQMTETRHIYREEEPKKPGAPFMRHFHVSDLGNIRVVDSVKTLPPLTFPGS